MCFYFYVYLFRVSKATEKNNTTLDMKIMKMETNILHKVKNSNMQGV